MAAGVVPHFANDAGLDRLVIGVREFKCMGARPPFDHPHVYLDMGSDNQVICPYCSTLYIYNGSLGALESIPANALVPLDLAAVDDVQSADKKTAVAPEPA